MVVMTHNPIKLIVDEPQPGSFFWVLVQTALDGRIRKRETAAHA